MTAGALAGYADWPAFLASAPALTPDAPDQRALADVLGVHRARAVDITVEREWVAGGVHGRELSWWVGFGPRTRAFLLRPEGEDGDLPGVLALHCHGGVRSTGADQLVDIGDPSAEPPHPSAARLRASVYAGRALASDLARAGFAVLAHDTFSWGSRAFDLSSPTPKLARIAEALDALHAVRGEDLDADARFDEVSAWHEETLAKAAGVLGTTFAGAVVTDDLAALEVLATWPGVDGTRLATIGMSGGGGRALLTAALDDRVRATVIACMMATSASLIPDHLDTHSWLLHSPGLARRFDWPAITAVGAARRTLVQYGERDPLFPAAGMRDADAALRAMHDSDAYRGSFHDAAHEFSAAMQDEAQAFLDEALGSARGNRFPVPAAGVAHGLDSAS